MQRTSLFLLICLSCSGQGYHPTDLGLLPSGKYTIARKVNNSGVATGVAVNASGVDRGYLWSNGTLTVIEPMTGFTAIRSYGLNNNGDAVGCMQSPSTAGHAMLRLSSGALLDINPPGAISSCAYDVNDAGVVVGYGRYADGERPFIWSKGAFSYLPVALNTSNVARGINLSGAVVGHAVLDGSKGQPFLWNGATMTDLGDLGYTGTTNDGGTAHAINSSGMVAGEARNAAGKVRAFRWANGSMADLGDFGGLTAYSRALNEAGHVTGMATDADGAPNAFVFDGSSLRDLNCLAPPPAGWRYTEGRGINDLGAITVTAQRGSGEYRAYLLTPLGALGGCSLMVTSPNGPGIAWQAGEEKAIRWKALPLLTGPLKIELLRGGAVTRVIASGVPVAQGQFTWTVPATLDSDQDYRIRITSEITGESDWSNVPISIASAPSAQVRVVSPNGGESVIRGGTSRIQWQSALPGDVRVDLYRDGIRQSTIGTAPATAGSMTWSVPASLAVSSTYRVAVLDPVGTAIDLSDGPFSVVPSPAIAVNSPAAGAAWAAASTQTIRWRVSGSAGPSLNIQLWRNGSAVMAVASGVPSSESSFNWTLPVGLAVGSGYRLRVSSESIPNLSGDSAVFTVTPRPVLRLLSPNGGERWYFGSSQQIRWSAVEPLSGTVKIDLLKDGALVRTLSSAARASAGFMLWTPPVLPNPGDGYTIAITGANGAAPDSSDGTFSLLVSPSITISAPAAGASWKAGSTNAIRWRYQGDLGPALMIELYRNGLQVMVIAPNAAIGTAGSGMFNWAIPAALPPGSGYAVKLSSVSNPIVFREGVFTVIP